MKKLYQFTAIALLTINFTLAQNTFTARLTDSLSGDPIPFATITLNKGTGVISSENGMFTLNTNISTESKDSLYISCLGYRQKIIPAGQPIDSIIQLIPADIELNEVILLNRNYTTDEILEQVKARLAHNYDTEYSKQKLFFRRSSYTDIQTKEIRIKESSIPEFDQDFMNSTLNAIPDHSSDHTEILGVFCGRSADEDAPTKLEVLKASELYDKKNRLSLQSIEKKLQEIVSRYVKPDSYFKIRSGIIGGKTEIDSSLFAGGSKQMDSLVNAEKREEERKKNFLDHNKRSIAASQQNIFLDEDSELNILEKQRKYEFTMNKVTILQNEAVYKIDFKPKRGADYRGTLYVNADDYAIIRLDYINVKSLKKIDLFGISYNHYGNKGTVIYGKNERNKYALKYMENTDSQKMGFDRPLKIIEKNKYVKGRRKQNELSSDVHFVFNNVFKKEMIVFENTMITEQQFNSFREDANVIPVYMPHYEPEFWKGYNIIEPNKAIKEFKSIDE